MIRRALLLLGPLCLSSPAGAALSERDLAGAVARPPRSATLPANLPFINQYGVRTTLGAVAGARPLVLIFADFTCRHVCAPGLTMTAAALAGTGLSPGRDYALAVVGIDPRDSPADARHLAEALPPTMAPSAALLSGDRATVQRATQRLGYGYAYDAASDQFAHDAAVYVFGRDRRLVALLPELGLQPAALTAALSGEQPAQQSLGERVARLCYGFAAAHGRFGGPAVAAIKILSLSLLAVVGVLVWRRRTA